MDVKSDLENSFFFSSTEERTDRPKFVGEGLLGGGRPTIAQFGQAGNQYEFKFQRRVGKESVGSDFVTSIQQV